MSAVEEADEGFSENEVRRLFRIHVYQTCDRFPPFFLSTVFDVLHSSCG